MPYTIGLSGLNQRVTFSIRLTVTRLVASTTACLATLTHNQSKGYLFNQANSHKTGSKRHEVPLDDLRLIPEGVSPAGEVCGVGGEVGVESFNKPKGTVVDGLAQDAHVVCVEHAVSEADCLPFGY